MVHEFRGVPASAMRAIFTDPAPRLPELVRDDAEPSLPFIILDRCIREGLARGAITIPRLEHAESLSLACDFGGDFKGSSHRTLSFLCSSFRPLDLERRVAVVRAAHGLGTREISWKNLNGPALRALPAYLKALDELVPGLLVTIALPRDEAHLLVDGPDALVRIREGLQPHSIPGWKEPALRRALWIAHACAYVVALLGRAHHRVLWLPDNDEIVANGERAIFVTQQIASLVAEYSRQPPEVRGYATPFTDRSTMTFLDLLSATDLAAATLAEGLCMLTSRRGSQKRGYDDLTEWLSQDGVLLRKINIVVTREDTGELSAGLVRW